MTICLSTLIRQVLIGLSIIGSPARADDTDFERTIVTRQQWRAHPPLFAMPHNVPTQITIHHTGVVSKPSISLISKLQSLQAFSQTDNKLSSGKSKPAWGDIPYHFYIDATGRIGEGLPVTVVGDTNTDYNPTGHISVVLEGNFDKEKIAPAQAEALVNLVVYLIRNYKIKSTSINTHQNFAQTSCPGRNFRNYFPILVDRINTIISGN